MDVLIFIISAIILYPVLGTIFGILLTLYKLDNLRLKIFLLTISRPFIYTIILWLIFPSTFNNSLIWLGCFFVTVLLRDTIFSSQRFLSRLKAETDNIFSIEYIDSLFKTKHFEIMLDDNKHLDLSEIKSLIDYPPSLTFIDNDNKNRFIILNRQIWTQAGQLMNAANKSHSCTTIFPKILICSFFLQAL